MFTYTVENEPIFIRIFASLLTAKIRPDFRLRPNFFSTAKGSKIRPNLWNLAVKKAKWQP